MKKIKISAIIITFNEEKNIERCLKSLKDVADEIVVVDSFSTDKTEEICHNYSVRFIQHTFDGHIEQKNFAKDQANYDFVLSLDADEALSSKMRETILSIKNDCLFDGFYFRRTTNFCGKWIRYSGWYPDWKLRLWNRHAGKWQGLNPHDRFEIEEGTTTKVQGDILHYSFDTIDSFYVQQSKFALISANALLKRGKKSNYFLLFLKPLNRFIRDYFYKLGFLDGRAGFIICMASAYTKFIIYSKMLEEQQKH